MFRELEEELEEELCDDEDSSGVLGVQKIEECFEEEEEDEEESYEDEDEE